MWYLFFQIWVWLLAAFILGWAAHWFLCCRGNNEQNSVEANASSNLKAQAPTTAASAAAIVPVQDSWKPQGFATAPENADDLKRIKGVGAVIEETLNGLGIYQFQQIASWSDDNTSWVENFLAFPGRIQRENWIEQARTLSEGGTTEFASRVDKGEVDYD